MGGEVSTRLQRSRRPSAWLEDFVIGGKINKFLTGNRDNNTQAIKRILMKQRQLESPSLESQEMRHSSDGEEGEERLLPDEK